MSYLIDLFNNSEVAYVELPTEPEKQRHWFRATELCKILLYPNTHRAVTTYCKEYQYRELQLGKGRPALYVTESGVYRLILRSKAPIAIEFQDWLTEELLPKLRSQGLATAKLPGETEAEFEARTQFVELVNDRWETIARLMVNLASYRLPIMQMVWWMNVTYKLELRSHHINAIKKLLRERHSIKAFKDRDEAVFTYDGEHYHARLQWLPELIYEAAYPLYPDVPRNKQDNEEANQKCLRMIEELKILCTFPQEVFERSFKRLEAHVEAEEYLGK